MPPLESDRWPEPLRGRPEVAGVNVRGCVDGERRFRRWAHAHVDGPFVGWICYLGANRLADAALAKHELAHILTGRGHDDVFRAKLAELNGGALPKDERKIPRAASRWCKAHYHGMCRGKDEGSGATYWYDREGRVERVSGGRKPGKCRCWCHGRGR